MPEEEIETTEEEAEGAAVSAPQQTVAFPWLMLAVAIFFDLIGMIPIINFLSEILASFIFGFWQKSYVPKTNPIINLIVAKIADFIFLGFLPSNIAIVGFAYLKKKVESKVPVLKKQEASPQPA